MSHLYLDDILAQRLNNLIPENKDNTDETSRKIERFKRNIEMSLVSFTHIKHKSQRILTNLQKYKQILRHI